MTIPLEAQYVDRAEQCLELAISLADTLFADEYLRLAQLYIGLAEREQQARAAKARQPRGQIEAKRPAAARMN